MKTFKFLEKKKREPTFQFEIVNRIDRRHTTTMYWSRTYSDEIKKWICGLYVSGELNAAHFFKYIPSIDRACEIMYTPTISRLGLLKVSIKIWKSDKDYMILHLKYPINDIVWVN